MIGHIKSYSIFHCHMLVGRHTLTLNLINSYTLKQQPILLDMLTHFMEHNCNHMQDTLKERHCNKHVDISVGTYNKG